MPNGATRQAALERYRETAIAFDDLIVQVGRAVAQAQEAMDRSQAEFQREIALALREGRLRRLDVPPLSAFSLPETKLDFKVGLSMEFSEEGPALSAVPLNAATTNQNDIDVEAATEVSLRFVSVPQAEEPPGPPPSVLAAGDVPGIAGGDARAGSALDGAAAPEYLEDERLWLLSSLEGREPRLTVVVDDRRGEVVAVMTQFERPATEALEPVGAPRFAGVEPGAARRGEIVTVRGDNFMTLGGQTAVLVDGRPVPPVRLAMGSLAFKVPAWATRGDVEVETPLGTTGEAGHAAFRPIPTFAGFAPGQGTYDAERRRGTWLSVDGANLRPHCTVRFATGVPAQDVRYVSPGRIQVEVPGGAGSGPLTLVCGEDEQALPEPFVLQPRVGRVSPRQARVGDVITLSGSALTEVDEISFGSAAVPRRDFALHSPGRIDVAVPVGATDGPLRLALAVGGLSTEVATRDIFYVVPRITGFDTTVVTPGRLITIHGDGLDHDPGMMTLLFDGASARTEGPILAVAADRLSLTARVPADAVTGFVLLLRKRVYSEAAAAETSATSANKLTVLAVEGDASDVIVEERFDGDLAAWVVEAGEWRIEDGRLASAGPSRLRLALPAARDELAVYADVLAAGTFGFSLRPAGGGPPLQVWVDLAGTTPALTFSTLEASGQQRLLDQVPLAVLPGDDHLVQLLVTPAEGGLGVAVLMDQEVVHGIGWTEAAIETLALLADAPDQRWDNVIVLKEDLLRLPAPELYRFASIPEVPERPELRIDAFTPDRGPAGTEVTLSGIGFDGAARFFFGGVEAPVVEAAGDAARITVPEGARTGPLEVHGRAGVIATTRDAWFIVPPEIVNVVPAEVLAGDEVAIIGTNLPIDQAAADVTMLDQPAEVSSASSSMLTTLVPDITGTGAVRVTYEGFTAEAPAPLEVRREIVLLDLIAAAPEAEWSTAYGPVEFGALSGPGDASVQVRVSERLEDGNVYGPVLVLQPPSPAQRALRGVYPEIEVPEGRVELQIELGFAWLAADLSAAGLLVGFAPDGPSEEEILVPSTTWPRDGLLESLAVDAAPLAGRRGRITIALSPGPNSEPVEFALVRALATELA